MLWYGFLAPPFAGGYGLAAFLLSLTGLGPGHAVDSKLYADMNDSFVSSVETW
jgi:hypothetical protein